MTVQSLPLVQVVTFEPSSLYPVSEGNSATCEVPVTLSTPATNTTITISPFFEASTWENLLNQADIVKKIGNVSVSVTGIHDNTNQSWSSSDSVIKIEVVLLTYHGVTEREIPLIMLDHEILCLNSSLKLKATSKVTQPLMSTATFSLGFNETLSGQPRFTYPLAVNITPEGLQMELKEILSWGCIEDDSISRGMVMYKTYETSDLNRTYPTSFCGFQSEHNPTTIRSSTYTLQSTPYVSQYTHVIHC